MFMYASEYAARFVLENKLPFIISCEKGFRFRTLAVDIDGSGGSAKNEPLFSAKLGEFLIRVARLGEIIAT